VAMGRCRHVVPRQGVGDGWWVVMIRFFFWRRKCYVHAGNELLHVVYCRLQVGPIRLVRIHAPLRVASPSVTNY
jgi:hypothetical protein